MISAAAIMTIVEREDDHSERGRFGGYMSVVEMAACADSTVARVMAPGFRGSGPWLTFARERGPFSNDRAFRQRVP